VIILHYLNTYVNNRYLKFILKDSNKKERPKASLLKYKVISTHGSLENYIVISYSCGVI